MGDGISILTNLSKVGAVSRLVQGQQTAADTQERLAKQAESVDPESVHLKDVEEDERARLKERRDERQRRRRRREAKGSRDAARRKSVGRRVDLKV